MKKRYLTKVVALLSMASISLTGCNSFISEDVASYPLAAAMTSAELVDYYAKALEYDSIVSRNVNVHETKYVVKDIEGEKSEVLKDLASKCEQIIGLDEYKPTEESLRLVSSNTYDYIKCTLDNEVLTEGKIQNITGALGYYFVDIKYNISPKQEGTFKEAVNIAGLNGAFHKDYLGNYIIDEQYMTVIVSKLNEYYYSNGINKCATYNSEQSTIKVLDDTAPIVSDIYLEINPMDNYSEQSYIDDSIADIYDEISTEQDENIENDEINYDDNLDGEANINTDTEYIEGNTNIEETQVSTVEQVTNEVTQPIPGIDKKENNNYSIVTNDDRRLQLDISLINKLVGASAGESAMIPDLDLIYIKPEVEGTISGLGIYTAGANGLKTFGFDRSKLTGTVTLRYVFKDDSEGSGDILGVNIYAIEEEITNGINISSNNVLIPEFLQSEFEQLIERADRVIVNNDISGMLSGNIFEDIGIGVLRGYKDKSTSVQKYMSTIRQIINRDTFNNSYLLEVETTTIEGARDVDSYGTYKDISYVVIQQQGNKFVITDWCRVSRTMTDEPDINPDSNTQKRLIALNLSGIISDDSKDAIKELLGYLYTSGTNRLLRGPKDITIGGETKTIKKGMYDCFSSDTSILSSDELEYENSTLRSILIKYGTDVRAVYSGSITEWIGGYEDQAEFTTEELVTYQGLNRGYYMQVYYLAHVENDEWVIAERTVLDEYEITDIEKLASVQERVGQSSSK